MKSILKFLLTIYFIQIIGNNVLTSVPSRKLTLKLSHTSDPLKFTKKSLKPRKLFGMFSPMSMMPGLAMGMGMGMMGMGMGMGAGMNNNMGMGAQAPGLNPYMSSQSNIDMSQNGLGNISTDNINIANLSDSEKNDIMKANELLNNPQLDVDFTIPGVGNWQNNGKVRSFECNEMKKEAVQIATMITRRQNKVIFEEIMKYVLKSKYLLGITEINMTKALRQKVLDIMKKFSDISEQNFNSISPTEEVLGSTSKQNGSRQSVEEIDQTEILIDSKSMTDSGPDIDDVFNNK